MPVCHWMLKPLIPDAAGNQSWHCSQSQLQIFCNTLDFSPNTPQACLFNVFQLIQLPMCCLTGDCPFPVNPGRNCSNCPSGTKPSPIDPSDQVSHAHTPPRWILTLLSLPTNWQAFSFVFLSSFISSQAVHIDNFLTAKYKIGWGLFSLFSSIRKEGKKKKKNTNKILKKSDPLSFPNLRRGWVPPQVEYCSSPQDHIPTTPLVLGLISVLLSQMWAAKHPCEYTQHIFRCWCIQISL